jgi:hypothetical protein
VYKHSFYASAHKIKLERTRRHYPSFFSSCDDNGEDVRRSRYIRKQPWKRTTVASLLGCLITCNPKPATSASNRRDQLDRGFTGGLSDLFLILGKTDLGRRSEFTGGAAIMNYWAAAPNRGNSRLEFTGGACWKSSS